MAKVVSFDEALRVLLEHSGTGERQVVRLTEALGHVLAEPVCADRDMPPFDRAMMDGYALCAADSGAPPVELQVVEQVTAGELPVKTVRSGQAARIMTGSVVPAGADAVVMIERTRAGAGGGGERVVVESTVRPGENIARQGSDVRAGQAVIPRGRCLGPAEVGVLAAVGCTEVPVWRKPSIAVMGSGDEVLEPGAKPGRAQIRNSNSYQILAQAEAHGLRAEYLGIAPDEEAVTRRMVQRGLEHEVFISTGGVSVGDKDYVGAAFGALGVEALFTKIEMKPGKPTFFGRRGNSLVFGLPGNPVAALATFHLLVMTAIRRRQGLADPLPRLWRLPFKGRLKPGGDRPTFWPARLMTPDGDGASTAVAPLEWHGSGDLAACVGAQGFVLQQRGEALEDGRLANFYPFPMGL